MEDSKVIFVKDSFYTTEIQEAILRTFPTWKVFKDTTGLSGAGGGDSTYQLINLMVKSTTEMENVDETMDLRQTDTKVDLFIFSAKLLDDGNIDVAKMKNEFGSENCKVIAISTMQQFLDKVKHLVDITCPKRIFETGGPGLVDFLKKNELI